MLFQGEVDPNSINYAILLYNEYFWQNVDGVLFLF